jgi:hypothetical protein
VRKEIRKLEGVVILNREVVPILKIMMNKLKRIITTTITMITVKIIAIIIIIIIIILLIIIMIIMLMII